MVVKTKDKSVYELTFITKPSFREDDLKGLIDQIENSIKSFGGNVTEVKEPMLKRLAHKTKGFKEGTFVTVEFDSPPEVPGTIKKSLAVNDHVMRSMILRKGS